MPKNHIQMPEANIADQWSELHFRYTDSRAAVRLLVERERREESKQRFP